MLKGKGEKPESAEAKAARLAQSERDQGLEPGSLTPSWGPRCFACGATPVVPLTGMCGPCTFGEAETIGGNW